MKKTIARIAYVAMAFSLFLCPEKTAAQFWNTTGNAAIATDFLGTTNAMSLKIRTNSIQRMSVESTGNVGIGAAFTSTRLLHVRKGSSGITSNASANLVVESNTTNYLNILSPSTTENGILFGIGGGFGPSAQSGGLIYNSSTQRKGLLFRTGGNVNRMTLDSTGRLGIGTTAPLEKLDVVGNASISGDVYVPGNLRNNNTAGEQIVKISTTAGSDCGLQINRPGVGFFDFRMVNIGGNLRFSGSTDEFATVNNEWMNLNLSNGNLGIGASPGAEKLSVCGTVRCTELRV